MTPVLAWLKGNPTRVAAVATIVIGWLAIAHVPDVIVGGLGSIVGILTGTAVYNAVAPVGNLVRATQDAATQAAAAAVTALGGDTAGAAGELTEEGATQAAAAAADAAHSVLVGLGIARKDRPAGGDV